MSLNRRRRIFRAGSGPVVRGPVPVGLVLAACGSALTMLAAVWLFVGPSKAPARASASSTITADADRPVVLDGDTMRIGDQVVRLAGIAAPARGSACVGPDHGTVDCGAAAANALAALVRSGSLRCAIHGHDGQGRPVADCSSAGVRLSDTLVRDGWARAEAARLVAPETVARAAGLGIWRGGS